MTTRKVTSGFVSTTSAQCFSYAIASARSVLTDQALELSERAACDGIGGASASATTATDATGRMRRKQARVRITLEASVSAPTSTCVTVMTTYGIVGCTSSIALATAQYAAMPSKN